MLPYVWAYAAWLGFSLVVYGAALWLIRPLGFAGPAAVTALLLAISWPPYLFETWIGGQVSVVGFLAIAGFLRLRRGGRMFLAGVCLALAAFKPTLVLVPAFMLLMAGEWAACGWILGRNHGSLRAVGRGCRNGWTARLASDPGSLS